MFTENKTTQQQLEMVYIENLVPQDHLLRKIDKYIDFSFIRDLTRELYCQDNGRPALDPIILFKMLFIGYLFGIRSERQLVRDIEVNVAYRWFLGFSLTDKVPDHSTISQNRRRRFNGTDVFQKVFDEIVIQAISHKLVDGKILYTDSTHLKANANKKKYIEKEIEKSVKDYVEDLNKAIDEDRLAHGKKPLKKN
jgi:transposase